MIYQKNKGVLTTQFMISLILYVGVICACGWVFVSPEPWRFLNKPLLQLSFQKWSTCVENPNLFNIHKNACILLNKPRVEAFSFKNRQSCILALSAYSLWQKSVFLIYHGWERLAHGSGLVLKTASLSPCRLRYLCQTFHPDSQRTNQPSLSYTCCLGDQKTTGACLLLLRLLKRGVMLFWTAGEPDLYSGQCARGTEWCTSACDDVSQACW